MSSKNFSAVRMRTSSSGSHNGVRSIDSQAMISKGLKGLSFLGYNQVMGRFFIAALFCVVLSVAVGCVRFVELAESSDCGADGGGDGDADWDAGLRGGCEFAEDVSAVGRYSGTTCGELDDVTPTCGSGVSLPDKVFVIRVPPNVACELGQFSPALTFVDFHDRGCPEQIRTSGCGGTVDSITFDPRVGG